MIELARKFVPATDEVWRLQNGKDPECQFFQSMAQHGHYGENHRTQQGIYVCAPSGKFLASVNTNNPDRMLRMMREGLDRWQALDVEQRTLKNESLVEAGNRAEKREPKEGLILALYARDLPSDLNPASACGTRWNRDTVWLTAAEARSLIDPEKKEGESYVLPQAFVSRLAALHLVDTVNGQTSHFSFDEVANSSMTAKVVRSDSKQIELVLEGSTRSDSERVQHNQSARGVVTRLIGTAVFDTADQRFVKFDIVALGRRWGYTPFNDRRRDGVKSNPLGFVLTMADPDEPPNVPAFIWAYGKSWVK